jgi:DNA-binding PadR family transcriptional regulator
MLTVVSCAAVYTEYNTRYELDLAQPVSVRHALLAILSDGPRYGLQLRQQFEARTGEVWPLNVGQVYTTLRRLERDGLVEGDAEAEGPQRTFRITPGGEQELQRWLETPPSDEAPPRDELVIKVLVAARLPGVDASALLQTHRRQLLRQMQRYTHLKEDAADDLNLLLIADAELYRIDATVRWLDSADVRLRQRPPLRPLSEGERPTAPRRSRRTAAR